jgi:hypothetical protein
VGLGQTLECKTLTPYFPIAGHLQRLARAKCIHFLR